MSYIVDGIGEFHSLGAALQAAVVTNDSGLPQLKILPPPNSPKALPAPPQLARPSGPPVVAAPAPASDPLETVLWVGLAALAAYAVYTLVKDDKGSKADAEDASDED